LALKVKRSLARPYQPIIPVVAVGNLTVGGTGKTPLVAALAEAMTKAGGQVFILSGGYGGGIIGPHLVCGGDTFAQVGDEAKWLSRFAPVVVAKHRGNGARWIDRYTQESTTEESTPDGALVIMDDGLQNTSITPHLRLAVFNGRVGIGNGKVIPSGPLREDFLAGLKRVDGVVINGEDKMGLGRLLADAEYRGAIFRTHRRFDDKVIKALTMPLVAFAGIGDPQGFFAMLTEAGVNLAAEVAFPDHHPFTQADIARLKHHAAEHKARLVTTEKDLIRIEETARVGITAIPLRTSFDDTLKGALIDMMAKTR
jgi:tetraacyldisaccharide 4'-kinase